MTIGEKIQFYRKQAGMSQEELGQKLLVSRQTVSLWEKGQTVPTIDNLLRLKEIFGVSVDELLSKEEPAFEEETGAKEQYQFRFSSEELTEIYKSSKKVFFKRAYRNVLLGLAVLLLLFIYPTYSILTGISISVFLIALVRYIRSVRAYKKNWLAMQPHLTKRCYEYQVFEDHFLLEIRTEEEILRKEKILFSNIEQLHHLGNYLLLVFAGQILILRKSELDPRSAFYSIFVQTAEKKSYNAPSEKWKRISMIAFIASFASVFVALHLIGYADPLALHFTQTMWVFFLAIPLPVASIIIGFILRAKGYKYKKNIIAGIIMTAVLCIFGLMTFLFSGIYNQSDEYLLKAEAYTGIDFPEYRTVSSEDWTKGTQTRSEEYIYYISDVSFDEEVMEAFEKEMATDARWLSAVPNELIGITSFLNDMGNDYFLIYNIDDGTFNTLPAESGTYRFLNLSYYPEENVLGIIEYDLDYVK